MKKNQFIDLEAQLNSSDEDCSEDEGEERQGNETFIKASSSTSSIHLQEKINHNDDLVERIEERYVKRGGNHTQTQAAGEGRVGEEEDRLPFGQLWLKGIDWLLWRVKCTPGQEYFIVYELMMRHKTLSGELRSAFYNPRDIGYIYLEANFTKSNVSSLREVLREYSDLRLSSLGIVPEVDLKRCLTIGSDFKQVFASGQWVSINRGLYRGDIGLVVEDLREEDSTGGVKVLVVPRLDYADQDAASHHPSKRKRSLRPSAQLFNPTQCVQEELVPHKSQHVFSYRSWHFEYGLLLKTYNENTLSPAREVPSSVASFFLEAKRQGADIELESRPTSSLWRFEPGEPVLSTTTGKYGTMASSFDPVSAPSPPLVDFEEGTQVVAITSIIKDITLGQYVEVLAGVHSGKKGFVVAKTHALLGISFNSNAMDVRLHTNSVRISTPDFLGTEIPWLNVRVKLLSGGLSGVVKDVEVTSSRSLAITVRLDNGHERTVGYHAVREQFSGQLLMDHQPLKRHQQQFNVEAPWKEIRVTILSGRFSGHFAIVKHAWIDSRSALRLSLWVMSYNCSIEVDYSTVQEEITGLPLHVYRPLEGNQLKEFAIQPTMEAMRTGPLPWLGLVVNIVKGHYKGQSGVVRDVKRYRVDSSIKSKLSGVTLTVERHVFPVVASTILVEVDYDAVRFNKTRHRLCEVFLPTAKQSFYCPEPDYLKEADVYLDTDGDVHESSKTPLPNDFERETIFYGSWSPNCPTPRPSTPSKGFRAPILSHKATTTASPSALPPPDHWILHPKLIGISIKVDISSGQFDTSQKKDGIIVETVSGTDGIKVIYRRSATKTIDVPYISIQSFRDRPNPSREKGLMVVARNHPEHIGKLVRRIHHFYDMEKTEDKHWMVVQRVDRSGPKEQTLFEFLEFHPRDLEYVKETPQERKWSTLLLELIRLEHSHIPVEVRPPCHLAIST